MRVGVIPSGAGMPPAAPFAIPLLRRVFASEVNRCSVSAAPRTWVEGDRPARGATARRTAQ